MHSRRKDHRVARERAAAARDSFLLLCGTLKWSQQREYENERREANRLYSMVYLQVRQELKKERYCSGSAQHPINTKPKR